MLQDRGNAANNVPPNSCIPSSQNQMGGAVSPGPTETNLTLQDASGWEGYFPTQA